MKTKRILAFLLALAMVLSMAACGKKEDPPAPGGDDTPDVVAPATGPDGRTIAAEQVYRSLYSSEMTTMNYLSSGITYELEVGANTIDSLVENDTYGNIVPCAALSWETSADGLVWTFHLRPDQKWYDKDGNEMGPVTAHDYVAAARYVCDSDMDCSNSYMMDGWLVNATELLDYTAAKLIAVDKGTEVVGEDDYVKDENGVIFEVNEDGTYTELPEVRPEDLGVVAKDDLTLEYHLEMVRPYFLTALQFGTYWPAPAALLEQYGKDFALDNSKMWFNGAYILQVAEPQQKRVYVKNANNWDAEHIYIERIEETYNQEAASLAPEMFLRGEVDYAGIGSDIVNDWLADPEKSALVSTSRIIGDYSYFFGFNFEPKFDAEYKPENWGIAVNNFNFRKSLFHGIDKISYLRATFPASSPEMHAQRTVTPLGFASYNGKDYTSYAGLKEITETETFNETLALEYKEKAIAELEALGVTFPVQIPVNYNPSWSTWGNASTVLEQQLEELLGTDYIDVVVVEFAGNSFLNETRRNGNYALQVLNWGADFMDPETWADPFHYKNSYNFFCPDTDTYRVFQDTKTPETKALMEEYFKLQDYARTCVTDMDERFEAFAKAEAFYINNAIILPGYISGGSYIATKLNAFEGQYAMMGQSSSRFKGQHVYEEAMSQDMFDDQYAKWKAEMGL